MMNFKRSCVLEYICLKNCWRLCLWCSKTCPHNLSARVWRPDVRQWFELTKVAEHCFVRTPKPHKTGFTLQMHANCMQPRLHYAHIRAYEHVQFAFVNSLLSSVENRYSSGQFIMADVDAIALVGAIYGVVNVVAAFELRRKRRRSQFVLVLSKSHKMVLFFTCFINSNVSHFVAILTTVNEFMKSRLRHCMTYRKIRLEKYAQDEHVRSRRIL